MPTREIPPLLAQDRERYQPFWVLTSTLGIIPVTVLDTRKDLFPYYDPAVRICHLAARDERLADSLGREYYGWSPKIYRIHSEKGMRVVQARRVGEPWEPRLEPLYGEMHHEMLDAAIQTVIDVAELPRQWFIPDHHRLNVMVADIS